jgi:DNA-binding CsgD family transcriptional regulator
MGSVIAASFERIATTQPGGRVGHLSALLLVGAAIVIAEVYLDGLDHGTHLLVGLLLVAGSALFFGPGPAASGLALGACASLAVGGALVEGILASPHTYIQVALYIMAGIAVIALATMAVRTRTRTATRTRDADASMTALVEPLTVRETEILRLAASGISVDEIAAQLFVSPNTVKSHLTHVYGKLGVRGRPDAIRAGLHFGCLTPADICPHRFPPEQP